MDWMSIEEDTSSGVYAKRELVITRGQGAVLYDEMENTFIDCVGGQGSANIGHAHPLIQKTLNEQAKKLINCPEMFHNPVRAEFQHKLLKTVGHGMGSVFLCNSGTEAVEGAIKFAKAFTGKQGIVAAKRGFHGRTMGALSATWNKKYREPFEPLVPGVLFASFNNIDDLRHAVNETTAAVILEIIQGEGGVYPIEAGFLATARQLCDQFGAMLIIDEVQSGFGRTGKFLALDHYQIDPDLICLAKSIAGGMPMGAVLLQEKMGKMPKAIHGSTFGGNPLACALGIATLSILEDEGLIQNAAHLGGEFILALQAIQSPLMREVRGKGLMVGVDLKVKVMPLIRKLQDYGILALPSGMTVLRFLPPLSINREQLNYVVSSLEKVLQDEI